MSVAEATRTKRAWWSGLLLAAMAALYFVYRGPYRALGGIGEKDLNVFYAASRAWMQGTNPYDAGNLSSVFATSGFNIVPDVSLNPPTTFVLLAPWAALPWPLATTLSIALNVLLSIVSIAIVMSVAELRLEEPRGILFLAFGVALAPFHTTIASGQLTIAATALIVASLWGEVHERPILSGIAIALAVCLKPQVGAIFVLAALVRARWRTVISCVLTLAAVAGVAVARLALAGVDWLPTLVSNLAQSMQGGDNDPTAPNAYNMINLQPLLHVILPGQSQLAVTVLTVAVGTVAGAVLALSLWRRTDREGLLLLYSGCAVLTLLVVYNRIYSATLLILPVAWVFASLRPAASRNTAIVIVVAASAFLAPGAAALGSLTFPTGLQWIGTSPWWRYLLLHQIPALVVILLGVLMAARQGAAGRQGLSLRGPTHSAQDPGTPPGVGAPSV